MFLASPHQCLPTVPCPRGPLGVKVLAGDPWRRVKQVTVWKGTAGTAGGPRARTIYGRAPRGLSGLAGGLGTGRERVFFPPKLLLAHQWAWRLGVTLREIVDGVAQCVVLEGHGGRPQPPPGQACAVLLDDLLAQRTEALGSLCGQEGPATAVGR